VNASCLIFSESRFQSIPTIIVPNLFQHLTFYYYFLTQIFGRQLAEIKIGVSWCVVKSKCLSILLFALIVSLKHISKKKKKKKKTKEFEHFYPLYIFFTLAKKKCFSYYHHLTFIRSPLTLCGSYMWNLYTWNSYNMIGLNESWVERVVEVSLLLAKIVK
jgi:hypothetical protein